MIELKSLVYNPLLERTLSDRKGFFSYIRDVLSDKDTLYIGYYNSSVHINNITVLYRSFEPETKYPVNGVLVSDSNVRFFVCFCFASCFEVGLCF